jgi:predicted RNA binding protein YcfA (HicA-like mRNA interferase family)
LGRLPRLTSKEAESLLLKNGFELLRVKGSHKVFKRLNVRMVIPFHRGKILHPKIVAKVIKTVNDN